MTEPEFDITSGHGRPTKLASPRNIAIALCVAVVVFFGGYFAAIGVSRVNADNLQAELNVCRKALKSNKTEISALKDSIDRLNQYTDTL